MKHTITSLLRNNLVIAVIAVFAFAFCLSLAAPAQEHDDREQCERHCVDRWVRCLNGGFDIEIQEHIEGCHQKRRAREDECQERFRENDNHEELEKCLQDSLELDISCHLDCQNARDHCELGCPP